MVPGNDMNSSELLGDCCVYCRRYGQFSNLLILASVFGYCSRVDVKEIINIQQ